LGFVVPENSEEKQQIMTFIASCSILKYSQIFSISVFIMYAYSIYGFNIVHWV